MGEGELDYYPQWHGPICIVPQGGDVAKGKRAHTLPAQGPGLNSGALPLN